MNPAKILLRRQLQQARLMLTPEQRVAKSAAINDQLREVVNWASVATLHFFKPIERLGEVDLTAFITTLESEYPGIKLFTSKQFDKEWKTFSLDDAEHVTPLHFDVIIVPMLGFDDTLQRIGYGGGFYDRFLDTQPQAKKIGVCFELGKIDHVPTEPHDIPLDTIVTEVRAYS